MTKTEIKNMSLANLIDRGEFNCCCGKKHSIGTKRVLIEHEAVQHLPDLLRERGIKKPFLLSGKETFFAAGDSVCTVLSRQEIPFEKFVFSSSPVLPDEKSVGSAIMHFDFSCDAVISIGSGVINDIGKVLANATNRPYIIVATAPSMDGFASATSSMDRDGLKISLDTKAAWAIVGDLDILSHAPMHMLRSGVGDMLAKYVSLAEWRIAHILMGEYYCPVISELVAASLDKVVKAAPKLLQRDSNAIKSVMEGMVIAGKAMKYAGLSRPASGMEHYFSHIWDMRALAFDDVKADLHGIQCGVGTLLSLKVYEFFRTVTPDRKKALEYVEKFDLEEWNDQLRHFIGPGAEAMIKGEKTEGKYDKKKHADRLVIIIEKWSEIQEIIQTMPTYEEIYVMMRSLGSPTDIHYLGYSDEQIQMTFTMTKDIRDKYIGSRLAWDLGLLDEAKSILKGY